MECARKAGMRDERIESVAYLVGHVGSGVAGYGDVRDLGVDLWKLGAAAAALSAFALVPV